MTWDAPERAALLERATKLAEQNGLKLPEGAVDKLDAAGVTIHFNHLQSDDDVLAKLKTLCAPAPKAEAEANLTGPGPKNPEFTAWLGGLAAMYDDMPAMRRLQLFRDFTSGVRPIAAVAPIGVKPTRAAPVATTAVMQGMSGAQKLSHLDNVREAQRISRELQGLKNSHGGGFNVMSARAAQIEKLTAKLQAFADRGVLVA
jgi:hypothetical protein